MWRIIIVLVLLIILFLMIRKSIRDFRHKNAAPPLPSKDMMVQDPVCKLYIAAGSAVVERIGGQPYHFCSHECAAKFKGYMSG